MFWIGFRAGIHFGLGRCLFLDGLFHGRAGSTDGSMPGDGMLLRSKLWEGLLFRVVGSIWRQSVPCSTLPCQDRTLVHFLNKTNKSLKGGMPRISMLSPNTQHGPSFKIPSLEQIRAWILTGSTLLSLGVASFGLLARRSGLGSRSQEFRVKLPNLHNHGILHPQPQTQNPNPQT